MNGAIATDEPAPNVAPELSGGAERYHHLDGLRGFALMLGVLFHAAESFGPDNHYWAVVDSRPSALLEWVRFGCHSFRMELFFVIAGFFARLLILKRGMPGFVRNRLKRIFLPLVTGWFVLFPILTFLWIQGWSLSGKLAELGLPSEAQNLPVWVLWVGFFATGKFIEEFDLTHLWFLHQLLAIYALALLTRWAWQRFSLGGGAKWDQGMRVLLLSSWALPVFVLITTPVLFTMASWGVDTPKESLVPYPPTTALYGLCFLLGWMLHRQPGLLGTFEGNWGRRVAGGITLCILLGVANALVSFRTLTPDQRMGAKILYLLLYSAMMWCFVFGFMGLFVRHCASGDRWIRYVADASYWIYLVHLPLVVGLQITVSRWALPWPIKYPLILVIAIPLLFVSYHFLVRASWIGVALNGRRYRRRWPWQHEVRQG